MRSIGPDEPRLRRSGAPQPYLVANGFAPEASLGAFAGLALAYGLIAFGHLSIGYAV